MSAGWAPTAAFRRAVVVVAVLPLAALVFGRPDLLLIAIPFAIGTAAALATRPSGDPAASLETQAATVVEGDVLDARVSVTNPGGTAATGVVTPRAGAYLTPAHSARHLAVELPAGMMNTARFPYTVERWGARELGTVTVRVFAADGLLEHTGQHNLAKRVAAFPIAPAFESRVGLPRAAGMAGVHRSRRYGESGELAGVRPFQPGDRLRRVNWRTTVRTGSPHVNATLSERDAEVVILIDVMHEAGESGGISGSQSALDAAVRAAAALTEYYTHQGDRVALVEFGRPRTLRPGTGRRHLLTALEWLTGVKEAVGGGDRPLPSRLVTGAGLIIMLTPLLDERSATALATLAGGRHSLIAVDTLPEGSSGTGEGAWADLAERLWRLERANLIGRLREAGVPVEAWRGSGSLDAILRDAARIGASR